MKPGIRIAGLLGGLLFLAAFGIYCFSGWSKINCWTREVDIASGRMRYTRYWFYKVTGQQIDQTWISEAVGPTSAAPQWHLMVTLSPGTGNSPNYAFLGADDQVRQFAPDGFLGGRLNPETRKLLAKNILALWQIGGDRFLAEHYLRDVEGSLLDLREMTTDRLPPLRPWLEDQVSKALGSKTDAAYGANLERKLQSYFSTHGPG